MSVPGKTYCACSATFVEPSDCNGCDAYAEEYSEDEHVMAVAQKAIDDIQAERIRAAGICVDAAKQYHDAGMAARPVTRKLAFELRDQWLAAARKIMGKT